MENFLKFSKENPVYEPESTPGREINAKEVLEDMEYSISILLNKTRDSIENGDYSMVLGIDGGGRLPALTIGKTIKEIYEDLNIENKLNINFIAGHRNEENTSYKLEDYFNSEQFEEIKENNKKILITEDVIESGNSLKPIIEILNQKGIDFDIATLSFSEGMMREYSVDPIEQLEKIENHIGSNIIFSDMDEISSVYGTKEMSGVKKFSNELFARGLNNKDTIPNPHNIPVVNETSEYNRDIVTYTRKKINESVKNLKEDFLKLTYHEQKQKEEVNKFESALESLKNNELIELDAEAKINFLNWVVQEKNYLLHGSNTNNIEELEPRLANCASKEFGNQEAVFANEDPNITMFYALRNKEFRGDTGVGTYTDEETSRTSYHFEFKGENVELEYCLKDGAIYLLDRAGFEQGHNNQGETIDEWASEKSIKPVAKLDIKVEDFPYLNEIIFTQIASSPEKEYLKEKFGITNLDEFQEKFFESDQELMKTGNFDYKNNELLNNRMKDYLEKIDISQISEQAKQKQAEMLWLWYHHAAQDAKERYQENEKAIEFIDKALEYKNISNSPNEITELLSLLYRDKFNEAESYIQNMDDMRKEQQEDASTQEVVNYEKETAQKLFEYYKSKN